MAEKEDEEDRQQEDSLDQEDTFVPKDDIEAIVPFTPTKLSMKVMLRVSMTQNETSMTNGILILMKMKKENKKHFCPIKSSWHQKTSTVPGSRMR